MKTTFRYVLDVIVKFVIFRLLFYFYLRVGLQIG